MILYKLLIFVIVLDILVDVMNMNKVACCMSVMYFWKHVYARIFYRNKIFYGSSVFRIYCQSFPILIIHFPHNVL